MTPSVNIPVVTTQTGSHVQIGDCRTTFLVSQTDTGGVYCVLEHNLPVGFPGPPPHAHRVTTHTFYVIEGTITIVMDGKLLEARSGTSVYIPAGVVHQFSNPGQQRARLLEIDTSGSFQAYFEALRQAFPIGQPIDQARMAQIQQQYDFIPAT